MTRQPAHKSGVTGARPECKHGNVFVGLYGEQLHVVCQCVPSSLDREAHRVLRDNGWFKDIKTQGDRHGEKPAGS